MSPSHALLGSVFTADVQGGIVEQDGAGSLWSFGEQTLRMTGVPNPDIDLKTLPKDVSPPDYWQDQAACYGLDAEVFFPTTEEEAGLALSYCAVCPVKELCLAWALKNGERYGVWGGTTEQQRRRLIRHVA